jgi:hypothetical protein
MSLLEWSPATNSIITVSIHYYERDEFKVGYACKNNRREFKVTDQLNSMIERVSYKSISIQHSYRSTTKMCCIKFLRQ